MKIFLKKTLAICELAYCTCLILSQCCVVVYLCTVGMLLVCGALVNGPYALITTAVSADLVSISIPEWTTSCL